MSQDSNSSSYSTHLQAGNALVAQAQSVATQDFNQARALWQAAGKEFYLAHKADMDQPEAAFRLAQAWMAEAHALQKEGSANAAVMWANAAAQCELAFDLNQEDGRVAMTAASCHQFAGEHDAAKAWQQIGMHLLQPDAAANQSSAAS
ncbi:MAG: hypothetical protein RR473_03040 [Comamonas sp.]|uniref:hypothetical protein n=1 Tax=unclassified Comamonas TaxID=2638500 RepID=UPI000EAE4B57|nr:hypothetical protein [Comamonas sp. lk]